LEDAINCFVKHPIHYLVVPPYIISKKEEVKNPLQLKSGKV
jgi:carbamoyltransferase